MPVTRLQPRFVDQVPQTAEDGVLYVALSFNTTVHLCACGCGNETWLPIRPGRHALTYDGENVTVTGSIGNWDYPCRSHYWITDGRIVWDKAKPKASVWKKISAKLKSITSRDHRPPLDAGWPPEA